MKNVMLSVSSMHIPSHWHFNIHILLWFFFFFCDMLLNPALDTSLNEHFNNVFAWSPEPISAFCMQRWQNEWKVGYLKFTIKVKSAFSCVVSQFKLEYPRVNPNQDFWIKQSQTDMFIRHCKCHKTCGYSLGGAQICAVRKANSSLLSRQFRFSCYCWETGSILLRLSCTQTCSPITKGDL